MGSPYRRLQILFCLIAGGGMFLPLITISAYGESSSISFIDAFQSNEMASGIINGKIVLAVLVLTFIMLLVCLKKDTAALKVISLLLVIATGVLFYIDIKKISGGVSFLSSMIKYSFGYYMSLVGIIVMFILGLIDMLAHSNQRGPAYQSNDVYCPINNYNQNFNQGTNNNVYNYPSNNNYNPNQNQGMNNNYNQNYNQGMNNNYTNQNNNGMYNGQDEKKSGLRDLINNSVMASESNQEVNNSTTSNNANNVNDNNGNNVNNN